MTRGIVAAVRTARPRHEVSAHRVRQAAQGQIALLVPERVVDVLRRRLHRDTLYVLAVPDRERVHQPKLLRESGGCEGR